VVAVSLAAHMSLGLPGNTVTCPCCTLYEQHAMLHTDTHLQTMHCLMCYCSRFRATQMSQRYAVCPSFYVNFTHMPAATPVGCVSVMLCSTFYVYFTHGCGNCRRLLLAAGLVWLQCDHRVLTATHEFWCNQGDIAARCPGTGSTWHKSCLTLHTCLLHTLCCCKLVLAVAWVQGSRSAQQHTPSVGNLDTAVPGGTLRMLYVQGHAVLPTQGYKCCCKLVLTCL
jgi:hypothetical protein